MEMVFYVLYPRFGAILRMERVRDGLGGVDVEEGAEFEGGEVGFEGGFALCEAVVAWEGDADEVTSGCHGG